VERYQEASSTSQLGWHPETPSSHAAKLTKIINKKGGKIITKGGGTKQKPSKNRKENSNNNRSRQK